jgi:hypothetical protein
LLTHILWVLRPARDECFESFFERSARQQYSPTAAQAAEPDIGAKSNDHPIGGSAGVGFAKPNDVVEIEIKWHRAS